MLQSINDLPGHVLGIHATGRVERDDIEKVLIPCLEEKVKRYGKIHYLLVLDTPVNKFTASALLHDVKAGLRFYGRWHRIAVVSDEPAVKLFTNVFRLLIPGKSKGFKLDKLDEAIKWISEK